MDEVKMIECVRSRPALYDKSDPRHTNRDYVQRLWEQVASEVDESVEYVKKKWTYFRDYFRKQRKGVLSKNTKSKHGGEKKKKWPLYDALMFLDTFGESSEIIMTTSDDPDASSAFIDNSNHSLEGEDGGLSVKDDPTWSPSHHGESSSATTSTAQQQAADLDSRCFKSPDDRRSSRDRPMSSSGNGKRKRHQIETDFDMQVLHALRNQSKEEDDNDHFFQSLRPMLRELDPLDNMRFRVEVQSLLISYVELSRKRPGDDPHSSYPSFCVEDGPSGTYSPGARSSPSPEHTGSSPASN